MFDNPPLNPIGFLGADWWGSDARAAGAELRRRGYLLIERHYEDYFPTRWRSTFLRGLRRCFRPLMEKEYNRAILELLDVRAMDFLLVFKGMLVSPATLRRFRDRSIPCYCLYPDVSFRDHGANIWECLPYYDCVFTTKSFHIDDAPLARQVRQLKLVSHGFDPEVHRRVSVTSDVQRLYSCDVSFVGYWSPKKEQILNALVTAMPNVDLKIWGPSWNLAGGGVRKYWQGRGAWGDGVAAIYACSRINLGLLSEAGSGTNSGDLTTARTWQIPASGGFLLHEQSSEFLEHFRPDVEAGVFAGGDDLPKHVDRWLKDERGRRDAAGRAWDRAHQEQYTYARAIDQVLEFHSNRTRR